MSDDAKLVLYDIHGAKAGTATLVEGEVIFPDDTFTWVWVMDARHAPYSELPLKDVLHRAEHAHKRWVLIAETADADA